MHVIPVGAPDDIQYFSLAKDAVTALLVIYKRWTHEKWLDYQNDYERWDGEDKDYEELFAGILIHIWDWISVVCDLIFSKHIFF